MGTRIIVNSFLQTNNTLVHDVQSTNLARLKQIRRLLTEVGYPIALEIRHEGEWHAVTFDSFEDRLYNSVPRSAHTKVLRLLRIGVNRLSAHYPHVISTDVMVPHSRTRRRDPTLTPHRM